MSPKLVRGTLAALILAAATTAVLTVTAPAHAAGTGTGYLHTSGNQIVDSTGATVRLTGINWFGMETDNKTFHGLWASNPWRGQLDTMARLGYNTLRVPVLQRRAQARRDRDRHQRLRQPRPGRQLSPLQILDKVIAYAGSKGMRIILDRHRPTAAGQTALWYTAAVAGEHLDRRLADAGPALRGQHHRHRRRPAQRAARRGHQPDRDRRLLGLRRHRPRLAAGRRAGRQRDPRRQPELADLRRGRELPERRPVQRLGHDTSNDEDCGWWGGNLSQGRASSRCG